MRRRGGRRWRIAGGLLLALVAVRVHPAEPDGAVGLRYAWEPGGHLRLTLQSFAPLDDVVVTWTGTNGAVLRATGVENAPVPQAVAGGERLALGRLEAKAARTFRLDIDRERGAAGGGTAVVRVQALLGGRPIQESLGIPLSEGDPGRLRLGAMEFDASRGADP